jgi:hypothetical protein
MSFDVADGPVGFLPRFLGTERGSLRDEGRRTLAGLSLSALFGLAIGLRYGPASMAVHAVGVPLGYVAGVGLALPALCIFVAHFDLRVDTRAVVHAVTRGIFVTGLVLAGLGPGATLLTLTSESPAAAAVFAMLGLVLGSAVGVREVVSTLGEGLQTEGWSLKLLLLAFVTLASLLALRAWWLFLPMLGRNAVAT